MSANLYLSRLANPVRFDPPAETARLYRDGDVHLDTALGAAFVRGVYCRLTATEVRLLRLLMQYSGRVVTRAQLLDAIWADSERDQSRTLSAYVLRLRKKLDRGSADESHIRTVRGLGYSFTPRQGPSA